MDYGEKKECIVFDDGDFAEIATKKKRYLSPGVRVAVWGICIAVVALSGFAIKGLALRSSGSTAPNGNSDGFVGTHITEKTPEVTLKEETEHESCESLGGDEEISLEKPDKESTTEEIDNRVSLDLSQAERGDAFIIDYSGKNPDSEGILEMGFSGGRYSYSKKPVVLILHTHTYESYWGCNENDPSDVIGNGVVSVGESIAYELNAAGIPTVHCTVIHGGERSAYDEAAETIKDMLKIYPSIEYVIDVHRLSDTDEKGNVIRTQSALGTAQLRITVSENGGMARDTLALALSIRQRLNSNDKRLCLPVVYTDSAYNSGLVPYYLKVDVGSMGNSRKEAEAVGIQFAEVVADLLKKR